MHQEKQKPGFDRRMTREEINELPIKRYKHPVSLIRDRSSLASAVSELKREKVLGFDTETRPAFKKGESYPPALIQLAGKKKVYLFLLGDLKFPRILRELLAAPKIIKAGVALHDDIINLKKLGTFEDAGFMDLSRMARKAGIKNHGLRGLAAVLMGFRISKKAQRSNWARKELTSAQIMYAAMDAWLSRELYLRLIQDGFKDPEKTAEQI